MKSDNEVIIIEIENNNQKDYKNDKDKETQICYICQEAPKEPINPSGCNHFFCRAHLKVI